MVGIELALTLVGYGFIYFLYKQEYKLYALGLNVLWTNALYMVYPVAYEKVIYLLVWLSVGVLVVNYKLFLNRLNYSKRYN